MLGNGQDDRVVRGMIREHEQAIKRLTRALGPLGRKKRRKGRKPGPKPKAVVPTPKPSPLERLAKRGKGKAPRTPELFPE